MSVCYIIEHQPQQTIGLYQLNIATVGLHANQQMAWDCSQVVWCHDIQQNDVYCGVINATQLQSF